ncbi:MAG: aldose 1-epimerase family protein [Planctomycetota bacterium]
MQSVRWEEDSPLSLELETRSGPMRTRHGRFVGGRCDGVEIVRIETGAAAVHVLPTRGMSIWNIDCGPTRFGWNSPVDGPVHPALVPIFDPSGLGWLEGFDELLVRCGLESNGAPEFDESGKLAYPLHGRIGNLPADGLEIEFDEASGRLELVGDVRESRLFFSNLQMRSRIRLHAGSARVEIRDDVVNMRSQPATMQLLYHINVGAPVLQAGSKLHAPIEELAPKDSLSAGEIETWNEYPAPQSGYAERVYFARLKSDESNLATSVLHNADASLGLAVTHQTKGLPRFVVWKNTAHEADGYVTGLEPATNFPNTRSYEASQDRVVQLEPEQTASFRVTLEPLTAADQVSEAIQRVEKIAGEDPPTVHATPRPGWSPGA